MLRIVCLLWIVVSTFMCGCSADCKGLCGSECDRMDCSYSNIICYGRTDTTEQKKMLDLGVNYMTSSASNEKTIVITFEVETINPVQGHRFENKEFQDLVTVYKPNVDLPELQGNFCEINEGGDKTNETLSGKCSFAFVHYDSSTYFMKAEFSCLLESPPI